MTETDEPRSFQTLGKYQWPATPADESLKQFSWKIWNRYRRQQEDPFISDDSLRLVNRHNLDSIDAPPACGPILDQLQTTFKAWVADAAPARWLQLVVLPPGDQNDVVGSWAQRHGHKILEPPTRDTLLDPLSEPSFSFGESDRDGVLVIPRLERWFLRHYDGLRHVSHLLQEASDSQRHCVVACNSWAWKFLDKAIGAGLLLPLGLTFEAFDAQRLRAWFEDLAKQEDLDYTFRFSSSGDEVFAKETSNKKTTQYFQKLAASSLGVPWIAWHLWRRSFRFGPEDEQNEQPSRPRQSPNEKTLWVAALKDMKLPSHDVDATLLTLQSLLIHDGLTARELEVTTPSVDACNVLPSLVAVDFVRRDGDRYYCAPAAYPAIRDGLRDAGFPLDEL